MRRPKDQPTTIWSADVKKETLDKFSALFPPQGGRAWVVDTGLRKFLDMVETSPRMQRIVNEDIQRMLHLEEKDRGLVKINFRIPTELYNRFNNIFPQWGATSWFIRHVLDSMVDYMSEHGLNMEQLVEVAVHNILRDSQGQKAEQ